jgi:hypothetical protein
MELPANLVQQLVAFLLVANGAAQKARQRSQCITIMLPQTHKCGSLWPCCLVATVQPQLCINFLRWNDDDDALLTMQLRGCPTWTCHL